MRSLLLGLVAMLSACEPAPAPETSSTAPESVGVERVEVQGIPDSLNLTFPSIDPVSGDLWFSVYADDFDAQTVMRAAWTGEAWGVPDTASFSGQWGDRAVRFSPDGTRLYLTSNRPRATGAGATGAEAGDMNVWVVERSEDGWGAPVLASGAVNSPEQDIHASPTNEAIWVASNREETLGRSDIFRIDSDGTAEHFADPINDAGSQPDLWVSPDESWMILVMTDHEGGYGGDDLYLVERAGDGWAEPGNLGPEINTDEYEYGPSLSPDGERLYFTSHRDGESRVYRVAMDAVRGASAAP